MHNLQDIVNAELLYYINNFTKLINNKVIVFKEGVDDIYGKNQLYTIRLEKCSLVQAEYCSKGFNEDKCFKSSSKR